MHRVRTEKLGNTWWASVVRYLNFYNNKAILTLEALNRKSYTAHISDYIASHTPSATRTDHDFMAHTLSAIPTGLDFVAPTLSAIPTGLDFVAPTLIVILA